MRDDLILPPTAGDDCMRQKIRAPSGCLIVKKKLPNDLALNNNYGVGININTEFHNQSRSNFEPMKKVPNDPASSDTEEEEEEELGVPPPVAVPLPKLPLRRNVIRFDGNENENGVGSFRRKSNDSFSRDSREGDVERVRGRAEGERMGIGGNESIVKFRNSREEDVGRNLGEKVGFERFDYRGNVGSVGDIGNVEVGRRRLTEGDMVGRKKARVDGVYEEEGSSGMLDSGMGVRSGNGNGMRGGSAGYNREVGREVVRGRGVLIKREPQLSIVLGATMPSTRDNIGVGPGEYIRVQGKNGVLKVMVNNKNKVGVSESRFYEGNAMRDLGSSFADTSNWKPTIRSPFNSQSSMYEKSGSIVLKQDKNEVIRSVEAPLMICDKEFNERANKSYSKDCSVKTDVRMNEGESSTVSTNNFSTRRKHGEGRRGSGTEKQLLRKKIRDMLVDAGWTVEFRPRKNRNYQDAVYITPSGTEYWSIIKAYDTFLKDSYDEPNNPKHCGGTSSSLTLLPEISQLTRQARKKNERDMWLNRKDVEMKNEKKINFFNCLANKPGNGNGECVNELHKVDFPMITDIPKPHTVEKPSSASKSELQQGRTIKKPSGPALLVRRSNKGDTMEGEEFVPYTGKRTILSWLIDMGTVSMSDKVQYKIESHTEALLEGWITRDGIRCGCCSKILSVAKFEIHAGSKFCCPYDHIYLRSGVSLLQCQLEAWKKQGQSALNGYNTIDCDGDGLDDDTCGVCADGGDLICCDSCPSTFHQSCLDIEMLPSGDWHCSNCSCKLCGAVSDPTGQEEKATLSALRTCAMCEQKYHHSCGHQTEEKATDSDSSSTFFCELKCKELFHRLQKLLGVKHELEAGFSWSLIHRFDIASDTCAQELPHHVECNSKLAVALFVLDECFLPIIDRRSGINLIQNAIYSCGSNFNRLNYRGFYTIILERSDEIISAASIRIRGARFVEMPFIGTRHIYRRQGMCRRLFNAIESALYSLRIEKLIIPAISEHMDTWTQVFGFNPLEHSQKKEVKFMSMLVFPDTDLLQRILEMPKSIEDNVIHDSVGKVNEETIRTVI